MPVFAAIFAVWASLLGAAYGARIRLRLDRTRSIAVVAGVDAVIAASAVLWLGRGQAGILGAFGTLLPFSVAVALILVVPSEAERVR